MSVNSGKNVEKEVVSIGNTTPKKRGRKPGKKVENSIIVSNQKEKTTKKRTIKNISAKSSSVKEEKTKTLATPNKKSKRTLHLNLSNFTNDNSEITDITKEENGNNIGVICDAVETIENAETNNFNDVDNLVNSYDLVVDEDVLDDANDDVVSEDEEVVDGANNDVVSEDEDVVDSANDDVANEDENVVENVAKDVIEETVAESAADSKNSDIESVSKILKNAFNSHGIDTSINQNSPFFYTPSVFDKFDIDITYTDNSEEDNGAMSVPEGAEQTFDSDDNFEITRIEFNAGNYSGVDEEINANDDNSNLQEYIEDNLDEGNEEFDIIGGVVEDSEESITTDNNENIEEENGEFDFVSYDQFDIYASQENNVENLNNADGLNSNDEENNLGDSHYTLEQLDEIYDLNYLDDVATPTSDVNTENINEESNIEGTNAQEVSFEENDFEEANAQETNFKEVNFEETNTQESSIELEDSDDLDALGDLGELNLDDLLTSDDFVDLDELSVSDNPEMLDDQDNENNEVSVNLSALLEDQDELNALENLDDLVNLEDLTDFIGNDNYSELNNEENINFENQAEASDGAVSNVEEINGSEAPENNEDSADDVAQNDEEVKNEAEGENNEVDSSEENSKEANPSIPEGSVQLENNENSEKISNITYKLLNKILEVESEIKKEAADSSNGSSVFKEFSFDDTSSAISSAIQSKEFQNELEKIILGQSTLGAKPTNFAEANMNSNSDSNAVANLESAQMVQENIAPAEAILNDNSGSEGQGYDVDYSQILTPSADVQDSNLDEVLKDDEYDDNNFSIEKYFGISKVTSNYDDNNNDNEVQEENNLEDNLENNLESTTLDDILLEKIYEEDLNNLDLSGDSSNNPDDPASDLLAITESLSKAISDLENTPDMSFDPLEEDNKSFNILINKDDIFSVSILNETYDIVADFDGISIISESIHISTPKNNFFVKAGEDKYIEIHNNEDHFEVYTNFENIDFANAINNVEFSKKDNRLELNIKEAFKLASVKNKLQLSMLNTVIADMTSSVPSPDNIDENSICDNRTLLISEETQKVYLPYTLEEVMLKLGKNSEYKTAKEVIDKEYTVPLSTFKFPILSRFKEAYRFMRIKEKSSVYAAIDLALELMFNSNLNPAIIRACKDLKELNIYLDCLYENELEKFDCFKIVYKVLPKVK